ncbi:MAG: hypothetical protein RLP15_08780 [Cryomorphaceae bacterium]
MKSKYIGTLVGLGFAIPGLLTLISVDMMIFMFIPILSFLPIALPLEVIGQGLFEDYAMTALLVLFGLTIAFGLSSYYFFKHMILDRQEDRTLNMVRFWGYFGLQLIVLHPLIFYIWAFDNSGSSGDGQFMFGAFETFPISSGLFIILGMIIDFVKNKKTVANIG